MKFPERWPSFPILVVGIVITLLSAATLDELQLNGDLYGLLGNDDPSVLTFRDIASVTSGLEELLVICDADTYMPPIAVDKVVALPEITANTRTYIQPGKSSLYAFSLAGDPADYLDAGVAVDRVGAMLAVMAPSCGMAGTPAYIVESHDRLDVDLFKALCLALVLVTLLFAFVYRIGLLALLMMIPVGIGIAWGLAAYSLLRPELTLLAAAIPTLLIGIGIDHCIHMIQACRYAIRQDGLSRGCVCLASRYRADHRCQRNHGRDVLCAGPCRATRLCRPWRGRCAGLCRRLFFMHHIAAGCSAVMSRAMVDQQNGNIDAATAAGKTNHELAEVARCFRYRYYHHRGD
jgi:predicted RND superfamily exporter protein